MNLKEIGYYEVDWIELAQDRDRPGAAVHPIGTAGVVVSMQINGGNWPQASYTLYITGVCRFQVKKLSVAHPYRTVDVTQLDRFGGEADDDDPEVQTLVESFREDVRRMVRLMDATVPPVAKLKVGHIGLYGSIVDPTQLLLVFIERIHLSIHALLIK
uniref:Lon N-terminal domain-containing protein n=1 Tax=Timema monikensis TaxID=170555 RepID=A0A7R9HTS7_9NEOP|nr:unnamed protein product [Timema monikensis]